MKNDMFYDFPDNGCAHSKYTESKCEWETYGKKKYNTILQCEECGELAETKMKLVNA